MQNKDSIINFRLNFIVINREYMNFKLLKLNLKIAWLKFSGKIELIKNSSNFSLNDLESPKILIILPIEKELIDKSIQSISKVMEYYKNKDSDFVIIINNHLKHKLNFYNMKTHRFDVSKKNKINNSKDILDKVFYDDFDIVIDLNINFIFEISMFIQQLKSKYKVGFVSNYSDFFYNIQLQTDRNNPSYKSLDYLLGKI